MGIAHTVPTARGCLLEALCGMPRVDFATEIPRAAHEAAYGLGPVARGEVLGAEVVVRHAVGQHVIARHRAHVSPGRPDQRRLELGRAITHAGGAALPGTLVVCWDKGRPTTGDRLPRAPPWKRIDDLQMEHEQSGA
jgi:hypothetical protein